MYQYAKFVWDLYTNHSYEIPILRARTYLEPLVDQYWSQIIVTLSIMLIIATLIIGIYYIILKPLTHIFGWLIWLTWMIGIPIIAGYIAWNIPTPRPPPPPPSVLPLLTRFFQPIGK